MVIFYVLLPLAFFFIVWRAIAKRGAKQNDSAIKRHALGFLGGAAAWLLLSLVFMVEHWLTDVAGVLIFVVLSLGLLGFLDDTKQEVEAEPVAKPLTETNSPAASSAISEQPSNTHKLKKGRLDKSSTNPKKRRRSVATPKPVQTFSVATEKPSSGVPSKALNGIGHNGITVHHPDSEPDIEIIDANSTLFTLKEMAELILADDVVHQSEAEQLLAYLEKHSIASLGPAARELYQALTFALDDGHLDDAEAADIKALLSEICDRPEFRPARTEPLAKTKATPVVDMPPPPKPGDLLGFSYEDSAGNLSDRIVEFRSSSQKNGLTYLKCICTEAMGPRTFRADRMEGLFLPETGELIDDHGAYLASAKPATAKPKPTRVTQSSTSSTDKAKKPEIFFTGLWQEDRDYYEEMAGYLQMKVVKSMTKNLSYLCCGVNAGPKKIAEAKERGIQIVDISEFDEMIHRFAAKLDELNEADEQRA